VTTDQKALALNPFVWLCWSAGLLVEVAGAEGRKGDATGGVVDGPEIPAVGGTVFDCYGGGTRCVIGGAVDLDTTVGGDDAGRGPRSVG
jgi:hypothetical protein